MQFVGLFGTICLSEWPSREREGQDREHGRHADCAEAALPAQPRRQDHARQQ
jgi:hypothetical protein